jgi:hypothetical protein
MQNIKSKIVEVLKANEESLSDGYEFYCGGPEYVDETLERIAAQISSLLTLRPPDSGEAAPNRNAS